MKLTIGLNTYVLMNVQTVLIVFLIAFQTGLITESRNHVNAFDSVPRMNDTTALKTIFTAAHQILMMPVISWNTTRTTSPKIWNAGFITALKNFTSALKIADTTVHHALMYS